MVSCDVLHYLFYYNLNTPGCWVVLFLLLMLGFLFLLSKIGHLIPSKKNDDDRTMDDEAESLVVVDAGNITWHIRPYFQNVTYLGGGAFGNVCKADDFNPKFRDSREIAIKKLYRPFYNGESARRTYRELRLLRDTQSLEHDNVLGLYDVYTPDSDYRHLETLYFVTEHAGWDLHAVLQSEKNEGTRKLGPEHIQSIIYQLLRGLKYLHSGDIVHRDLKPTNLALSPRCDLTILDFGLARKVTWEIMTEYVITRYYRPPEVLCWSGKYDQKADMWSVGCIMAELVTNEVLFKGQSTHEQFLVIMKMLGSPSIELLEKIEKLTSNTTRKMIESFGKFEKQPLKEVFNGLDPAAVDFLEKVLVMDPDYRMSVEDALKHQYIGVLHVPDDEPVMADYVEFDEESLGRDDILGWKKRIWREVQECKTDLLEKAKQRIIEEESDSDFSN